MNTSLLSAEFNIPDIIAEDAQFTKPENKYGNLITQLPDNDPIEYDYNQSRANLYSLLSQGQEALNYALEIAKQSENSRSFEVVGNIIKQLADINYQLLDISEKKQKLTTNKSEQDTPTVTNNNAIFVGSTNELTKLLKQLN